MKKRTNFFELDQPLKLQQHSRPKTRREFISHGFATGASVVTAGTMVNAILASKANAAVVPELSQDILGVPGCSIGGGAGKIPFICFDLAGGANIAGSNVLVGGPGGQSDFLSNAGYSKQGLPADMAPSSSDANIDSSLGLLFHADSAFLRGIMEKTSQTTRDNINGAVIAARSENDTGNNPHNPMYAISMAGARGELLSLIGSRSSESGGNSMAPADMIDNSVRPTKIDRPSDNLGLVNVGNFGDLEDTDVVSVMESIARLSNQKIDKVQQQLAYFKDSGTGDEATIANQLKCSYLKTAHLFNEVPDSTDLSPLFDDDIVGDNGIFSMEEFSADREFQKTASIMKLVASRAQSAGAGTITMGGYDYHTGDRATGETRDLRAGRCMGACLEYAAKQGVPLMLYVFSDGSVFSNGMADDSTDGRGKGVWTGDNQQTASAFFLVYNPTGKPILRSDSSQQIGYMRASGDVETSSSPAGNNVNQLVQTVMLNYMALNGDEALFDSAFAEKGISHGLGSGNARDSLIAFESLNS